jgi:hypothetical protein
MSAGSFAMSKQQQIAKNNENKKRSAVSFYIFLSQHKTIRTGLFAEQIKEFWAIVAALI